MIFDNDTEEDADGRKRREVLNAIGVDAPGAVLTIEDFEMDTAYAVFGTDYEGCLRGLFADYAALEQEARAFLSSTSKPLVARDVARQLVNRRGADDAEWVLFESLAQSIQELPAAE